MKTLSRVYDSYDQAQRVVTDLETAGIASGEISLLANKYGNQEFAQLDDTTGAESGAGVGALVGGGAGLLAGVGLMAIPGLGPVVAAGWLASTALGAAAGAAAGGLVGALTDSGESPADAEVYAESVRRGGSLVTVRADELYVPTVQAILDRNAPINPAERRKIYEGEGWTSFDDQAEPYQPNQSEVERMRRKYGT